MREQENEQKKKSNNLINASAYVWESMLSQTTQPTKYTAKKYVEDKCLLMVFSFLSKNVHFI